MKLRFFSYIFRARFSFWVYSLENMANLSLLNNNMIFKGVIMSGVYHMILIFFLVVWRSIFLGCAFINIRRSICFHIILSVGYAEVQERWKAYNKFWTRHWYVNEMIKLRRKFLNTEKKTLLLYFVGVDVDMGIAWTEWEIDFFSSMNSAVLDT